MRVTSKISILCLLVVFFALSTSAGPLTRPVLSSSTFKDENGQIVSQVKKHVAEICTCQRFERTDVPTVTTTFKGPDGFPVTQIKDSVVETCSCRPVDDVSGQTFNVSMVDTTTTKQPPHSGSN
ncbi:uncharacterized protein LOC126835898 isoform X1 [Adelges cooleyi]|uniref:uncharacterized protein LOC126835898 isoform X1 n=1 Tax=Adelges cooleyi TaxID=133065 RepID=UPI00218087E9|nr:uncharacterized protein LOC126835898 isoform X1 [Adelges cooleyi]